MRLKLKKKIYIFNDDEMYQICVPDLNFLNSSDLSELIKSLYPA